MTPIDNAMKSKNAFLGFAGLIAAASVYMIWGSDLLPAEGDPKGNPETWTRKSCEGGWPTEISIRSRAIRRNSYWGESRQT
ncbi:hypothetical protein PG987_009631 [Apiospora arundinis]